MGRDRPSASSTLTRGIADAVGRELRAAAEARWEGSPDAFVWRARRCVEAVLYAELLRVGADVEALANQRKTLDQLLEHKQLEGSLSREQRAQLATLRDFGNIATHYQIKGGISDESAQAVALILAGLLKEFYSRDDGVVPAAHKAGIDALTDPNARILSQREFEAERTIASARLEAEDLRRALTAAHTRTHTESSPRPMRWLLTAGATLVIVCAVAFVLGRASVSPPITIATAVDRDVAPTGGFEPTNAAPAPPPPTAALLQPTVNSVSPPPSVINAPLSPVRPTPLHCPPGMQLIGPANARDAFCIDQNAVLEGAYRQCVRDGECPHPGPAPENGCNWQNAANALAANCLRWDFARTYCRVVRGGTADLPTRQEWTRSTSARPLLRTVEGTDEWSLDALRPGVRFVRGARLGAGFSWSGEPESSARRHISFRCVVHAEPIAP
ncbi:MAG: hypothetical protein U0326_24140 [Polyangiales bacterium]